MKRKVTTADATVTQALEEALKRFASNHHGKNASYIPYLASVPSQLFGISIMFCDGTHAEVGDTDYEFAIESISKVFTLAHVLDEYSPQTLRSKIGCDPTGEPFNSVVALELHKGRPLNPFVNAGAMATVSLIKAENPQVRWEKIQATYNAFAGRELSVNEEVYKSEAASNQHNRGIAWLLQSYGYMYADPMEVCAVYTRQCSVSITCQDLVTMGVTLANGGVNPLTGKRVVEAKNVAPILSEMTLNGLYDTTGDWYYKVGLPGKSGVGGGILAVVPGVCAIAAFAPPLDVAGNSVRGQLAAEYLSRTLNLSLLH
ncbi:MAG TPA: glutaminase [Pseudomonas sp.]|jgi:glutaminase|uniref:Glutaminase n=1 Tax=Pseudomonas helleri TaxID=1608996 RepID=A0A0J6IEU9_9PSED|nr:MULTISPECIES: glutaminase A [Pseudomonas]KMN10908.1 glutaminase [Pseudomonas helleri]MQT29912.1 glutaminase A [Pseudomonas helleri]MQT36221.1 glutaminase A [Pseudomonas helleri]MQT88290.1 glutaminase A [Pseudomonas helleri]MQU05339.1 glutaminase A [Pseudomonas helleri]